MSYGKYERPPYFKIRVIDGVKKLIRIEGEKVPFDPRSFTHGGPLGREESSRANK